MFTFLKLSIILTERYIVYSRLSFNESDTNIGLDTYSAGIIINILEEHNDLSISRRFREKKL